MIRAILLTEDNIKAVVHLDESSLSDYQHYLRGSIQAVRLSENLVLWCNEEGKLNGMKTNLLASVLLSYHYPETQDFIVGPALIVGPTDEDGIDTAIRADEELMLSALFGDIALEKEDANV